MRIAISGIGVVSAIGTNVEENFDALVHKKSGIGSLSLFSSNHQVPVGEVKLGNEALKVRLGINPRTLLSRTTLLGAMAAHEALGMAQIDPRLRIGLVNATSVGGMDLTEQFYPRFMDDPTSGRIALVAQHDPEQSTRYIASFCGMNAYTTTLSTACSSAANALIFGARLIRHNICDVVVAGGCDALSKFTLNGFSSLGILDTKPCKPFDEHRAGLNLGEGAGYVVLQRQDTLRNEALAYLSGYANRNDAYHQTASSTEGRGAYWAMSEAVKMARIKPHEIDYINVHGTGTPNNDAAESAALKRLFGDYIPPFSSTKPYTGHTLAAAGGIEAVYAVLALHKQVVYPNLNFSCAMKDVHLKPIDDVSSEHKINHVMSNSFGFGGNDSSLIFSRK